MSALARTAAVSAAAAITALCLPYHCVTSTSLFPIFLVEKTKTKRERERCARAKRTCKFQRFNGFNPFNLTLLAPPPQPRGFAPAKRITPFNVSTVLTLLTRPRPYNRAVASMPWFRSSLTFLEGPLTIDRSAFDFTGIRQVTAVPALPNGWISNSASIVLAR